MNYWYPQPYFIDKSMIIKEFLKSRHKTIAICAPQGFLKTSNIRMIASFVAVADDDEYLRHRKRELCRLKIRKERRLIDRHFGQHPVVFLTFGLSASLYAVDSMIDLFRRCYEHHRFLLHSAKLTNAQKTIFKIYLNYRYEYVGAGQTKMADALKTLCELLYTHYEKKVFVFIDDFDYPLLEAIDKGKPLCNIQPFVQKMLSGVGGSPAVKKILLTGLTSLTGGVRGAGGGPKLYKFLHDHPYAKFYGFTEDDVYQLANNDRCSAEIIDEILAKGYRTAANAKVHSPEWVHDFLKHKFIENDVHFKGVFGKPALRDPSVRHLSERLLEGGEATFDVSNLKSRRADLLQLNRLLNGSASDEPLEPDEVDLIFSLFFELGLFTFVKSPKKMTTVFGGTCLTRTSKMNLVLSSTSRAALCLKQTVR